MIREITVYIIEHTSSTMVELRYGPRVMGHVSVERKAITISDALFVASHIAAAIESKPRNHDD